MANEQLTTKGPSSTGLVEQTSKQILQSKLPLSEAIFIWYDQSYQNFPNIDGHIEFFDGNGSTTVRMFFQLRSSEKDITHHDCEVSFLNYCFKSESPTFLIFVNIPQGRVYWEHISRAYISSTLGIGNLAIFNQQKKRINFSEERVIDQNAKILEEVCRKHHQDIQEARVYTQEAGDRGELVSGQEPIIRKTKERIKEIKEEAASGQKQMEVASEEKPEKAATFRDIENKFASMLDDMVDKFMLYYAFIHVLKPFYLDQRGEKKRRALIRFLQLTDSQERFLVENLTNAGLINRIGDLIFVTQKERALTVFNHYIDNGRLNLEEIT